MAYCQFDVRVFLKCQYKPRRLTYQMSQSTSTMGPLVRMDMLN